MRAVGAAGTSFIENRMVFQVLLSDLLNPAVIHGNGTDKSKSGDDSQGKPWNVDRNKETTQGVTIGV